jgi:hypothetical protein
VGSHEADSRSERRMRRGRAKGEGRDGVAAWGKRGESGQGIAGTVVSFYTERGSQRWSDEVRRNIVTPKHCLIFSLFSCRR